MFVQLCLSLPAGDVVPWFEAATLAQGFKTHFHSCLWILLKITGQQCLQTVNSAIMYPSTSRFLPWPRGELVISHSAEICPMGRAELEGGEQTDVCG